MRPGNSETPVTECVVCARNSTRSVGRRAGDTREDTPTSPEVIVARTLNFRPNFKFSRLTFLGGPPSQLGCALGSLGQSLTRIKI